MDAYEEYAALNAMGKAVKERMAEIRPEIEGDMLTKWESEGIEKKALRLGKTKVGQVQTVGAEPSIEFNPEYDPEDVITRLGDMHLTERKPVAGWRNFFCATPEGVVDENGVVCDWLTVQDKRPTVRVTGCKPEETLPLLKPAEAIGLLGGQS